MWSGNVEDLHFQRSWSPVCSKLCEQKDVLYHGVMEQWYVFLQIFKRTQPKHFWSFKRLSRMIAFQDHSMGGGTRYSRKAGRRSLTNTVLDAQERPEPTKIWVFVYMKFCILTVNWESSKLLTPQALWVCNSVVPKMLMEDQKECCVLRCRELLDLIQNDPNLLNSVVTWDECWMFKYDPESRRKLQRLANKIIPNEQITHQKDAHCFLWHLRNHPSWVHNECRDNKVSTQPDLMLEAWHWRHVQVPPWQCPQPHDFHP